MNHLQIISRPDSFQFKINGAEIDHITGYEIRQAALDWSAKVKLEFEVAGDVDIDISSSKA